MTPRAVAAQGLQPGRSPLETATQGFVGDHRCIVPLRVAAQGFAGGVTPLQIAMQGLGSCIAVPFPPPPGPPPRRRRRRRNRDEALLFILR